MSRASIVGMLVAAEILIVGMAIFAVRGSGAALGAGMQGVDFTAAAQAPVSAGTAPHVVVDDANSRVHVGVSSDGLVHVRDLTQMRGAVFSTVRYPQLRVTRTADGVLVERPHGGALTVEIFGFSTQAIEVDVPSASRVEIAHCSGADVAAITGGATVRSQDGSIKLAGVQGTIDAGSDDGSIYATDVSGESVSLVTGDGRIEAKGLSVEGAHPQAKLHSDDGSVHVSGTFSPNGTYAMTTGDGSIELHVGSDADLAIDASTNDGRIVVDGVRSGGDDSASRSLRLGAGSSTMKLATSDGSIHIFTNGVSQ